MQIDFHTHGRLTKKNEYEEAYFLSMVDAALESSLDALVLSEHFNTTHYYTMYEEMERAFVYEKGHYLIHGLKVFMGLEVDVEKVRQALDGHTEPGQFVTLEQLLDLADAHDCLKIAAHPFRTPHHLAYTQDKAQLARFDALDLNATDIFTRDYETVYGEVSELARELGIVVVTGSDSHYPIQLGSNRTILPGDPNTASELRDLLRTGQFETQVSAILDIKVFAAKTTKAHIKSQLFGG